MRKTHFSTKVSFAISASNDPSEILEELQNAINEVCASLEKSLKAGGISYRIGDTFSDVYEESD